jgi:hypothetical protein
MAASGQDLGAVEDLPIETLAEIELPAEQPAA